MLKVIGHAESPVSGAGGLPVPGCVPSGSMPLLLAEAVLWPLHCEGQGRASS